MWLHSIRWITIYAGVKKRGVNGVRWRERKTAEVAEQMAKWQDDKLLIPCFRLAKETETAKSQEGAKSAAQCGTAHQNALQLTKTPVINASAAQN